MVHLGRETKLQWCQHHSWPTGLHDGLSDGCKLNPQAPDGVYKPPLVYCWMGFINTIPFPALHLSRNAAIVSESLKNDTETYSFINNRLRASEPSFCHLSTRSLPYALLIFRWLPVHITWKRNGNNSILCFFT